MTGRRLLGPSCVSALVAFAAACLDFTPLRVVASSDAGATDADTTLSACIACARGEDDAGGCATEYAQCNASAECQATVDCVIAQCFNPNANIGQCLADCEQDGGIASSSGAANASFAAFLQCMSTSCEGVCLQ